MIHFMLLIMATHQRWPAYEMTDVIRVVVAAVANETSAVRAELLIAIAQHESDLNPNAVSFVVDGRRQDHIVPQGSVPKTFPPRLVCGYLQAMGSRESCSAMMAHDGGMRYGASELAEWSDTCRRNGHHELGCVLRGTAGGTACAIDQKCKPEHAAFARWFAAVAEDLERRERAIMNEPSSIRTVN